MYKYYPPFGPTNLFIKNMIFTHEYSKVFRESHFLEEKKNLAKRWKECMLFQDKWISFYEWYKL